MEVLNYVSLRLIEDASAGPLRGYFRPSPLGQKQPLDS